MTFFFWRKFYRPAEAAAESSASPSSKESTSPPQPSRAIRPQNLFSTANQTIYGDVPVSTAEASTQNRRQNLITPLNSTRQPNSQHTALYYLKDSLGDTWRNPWAGKDLSIPAGQIPRRVYHKLEHRVPGQPNETELAMAKEGVQTRDFAYVESAGGRRPRKTRRDPSMSGWLGDTAVQGVDQKERQRLRKKTLESRPAYRFEVQVKRECAKLKKLHDHGLLTKEGWIEDTITAHLTIRDRWRKQGIWDEDWEFDDWIVRESYWDIPTEGIHRDVREWASDAYRCEHDVRWYGRIERSEVWKHEKSSRMEVESLEIQGMEPTRPLFQFMSEVSLKVEELRQYKLAGVETKLDQDPNWEDTIGHVAFMEVFGEWHQIGLWRKSWGKVPGLRWKHEVDFLELCREQWPESFERHKRTPSPEDPVEIAGPEEPNAKMLSVTYAYHQRMVALRDKQLSVFLDLDAHFEGVKQTPREFLASLRSLCQLRRFRARGYILDRLTEFGIDDSSSHFIPEERTDDDDESTTDENDESDIEEDRDDGQQENSGTAERNTDVAEGQMQQSSSAEDITLLPSKVISQHLADKPTKLRMSCKRKRVSSGSPSPMAKKRRRDSPTPSIQPSAATITESSSTITYEFPDITAAGSPRTTFPRPSRHNNSNSLEANPTFKRKRKAEDTDNIQSLRRSARIKELTNKK